MKRAVLCLLLAFAGCSRGHVTATQTTPVGPLPRPSLVAVTDFAVRPDEIRLDRGISAQVMRAANGATQQQNVNQAALETQGALTETLVRQLTSYGLPATRYAPGVVPPMGALLVQGQIISVDEGNRTRRTLIGLGAGKSVIEADSQMYYIDNPAEPLLLETFTGEADSGRAPGAAETMGAGAAAQRLATSAVLTVGTHTALEAKRTSDQAIADKLAEALARQIGHYAVRQGWIPASAVR